jgi:hypothetical protein
MASPQRNIDPHLRYLVSHLCVRFHCRKSSVPSDRSPRGDPGPLTQERGPSLSPYSPDRPGKYPMSPECRATEADRGCALQVTAAHDPKPISKPATGSRFGGRLRPDRRHTELRIDCSLRLYAIEAGGNSKIVSSPCPRDVILLKKLVPSKPRRRSLPFAIRCEQALDASDSRMDSG